jgi:hypothetical protein
MNASFAWDSGLSGKGVTTAVIDTGIEPQKICKAENAYLPLWTL